MSGQVNLSLNDIDLRKVEQIQKVQQIKETYIGKSHSNQPSISQSHSHGRKIILTP